MKYVLMLLVAVVVSCDRDKDPAPMGAAKVSLQDESIKVEPPTSLTAIWDGTEDSPAMLFSWNPSAAEGATGDHGFRIKRSPSAAAYRNYTISGSSSHRLSGLEYGTHYEWGVQAEGFGHQGYENSDWSMSFFTAQETVAEEIVEEVEVEENNEETGPSRVELPTLDDISSVPYEETGFCREGYRPNYEDRDGTCVPDCSRSYTWDDESGSCVSICSGPGLADGKYDTILGRCRCDNAGGYVFQNGACELESVPDDEPVEVSLVCDGVGPRVLTQAVEDHPSNVSYWWEDVCRIDGGTTLAPSAYPWTHSHTYCHTISEGVIHTHTNGEKEKVFWGTDDAASWFTAQYGHNHSDPIGELELPPYISLEDAELDKKYPFAAEHRHGGEDERLEGSHAHPQGSHGTDWCYQDESATCSSDGSWSCGS